MNKGDKPILLDPEYNNLILGDTPEPYANLYRSLIYRAALDYIYLDQDDKYFKSAYIFFFGVNKNKIVLSFDKLCEYIKVSPVQFLQYLTKAKEDVLNKKHTQWKRPKLRLW